jgi:hypothetical protein
LTPEHRRDESLGCIVTSRVALVALVLASFASVAHAGRYRYAGQVETKQAVLSVTAVDLANDPTAHAAVWLGAEDTSGSWVQAGIGDERARGLCVYAETMVKPELDYKVRCVQPITLGKPVRVRVTISRRGEAVVWVNGSPVASLVLGKRGPYGSFATAETYGGAHIAYIINGKTGAF